MLNFVNALVRDNELIEEYGNWGIAQISRSKAEKADDELRYKCQHQNVPYIENSELLYKDSEYDMMIANLSGGCPEKYFRLENDYVLSEIIRFNFINIAKDFKPELKEEK